MKKARKKGSAKRTKKVVAPRIEATVLPPKPRTVQDAFDAMKAAGELPRAYRVAFTPEVFEYTSRPNVRTPANCDEILKFREAVKKACDHRHDDGRLNIKWMEHSNKIVGGVCGQCFSQFDTRDEADLKLFQEDKRAQRSMGRAGDHAKAIVRKPVIPETVSLWEKLWSCVQKIFGRKENVARLG